MFKYKVIQDEEGTIVCNFDAVSELENYIVDILLLSLLL